MTASGRRRWGVASVVVALCAGLPAVLTDGAGAHQASAHAAACGNGSSGTSFSTLGLRGSRLISEIDIPVCVTGSVTAAFAGDPGAGCAGAGLCDYSGNETYAPGSQSTADLNITTIELHGHRATSATLFIDGPQSSQTSSVQRTETTGTGTRTTSCSDAAGSGDSFGGVFINLPAAGGQVKVELSGATPILGSRCAGPLQADVASAMPIRMVPIRTLERGEMTIDLTGGGQFAGHGTSGTVASTLRLRLGRPRRERQTPVPPAQGHTHAAYSASATYRMTRVSGGAVATVRSSTTPAICGPLDACGLTGAITVLPGASTRGPALLSAFNSSASARELRAELRGAGPPSAKVLGSGAARTDGSVQARLTQDGGTCSDTVALHQLTLNLTRLGHRLRISLSPSESQAADPLRTRCPGPDLGGHAFAAARLPASVLGRRAFTATLHGRAFTDGPYHVATRSTFAVTLRRGATRIRRIRVVSVSSHGTFSDNGGGFTRDG